MAGSGMSSMSLSAMPCQPRIEEPSKPRPSVERRRPERADRQRHVLPAAEQVAELEVDDLGLLLERPRDRLVGLRLRAVRQVCLRPRFPASVPPSSTKKAPAVESTSEAASPAAGAAVGASPTHDSADRGRTSSPRRKARIEFGESFEATRPRADAARGSLHLRGGCDMAKVETRQGDERPGRAPGRAAAGQGGGASSSCTSGSRTSRATSRASRSRSQELEGALDDGMGFDGSSITGLQRDRGVGHGRHPRSGHLPAHAQRRPQGRRA